MLPPHERYIEMFAGGLSMFFRKTKAKWNVVNDIDNDVVNLYISVLEEFDKLSEYIYWYPRSRTLFTEIKKELKEQRDIVIPDPKRAARYYYQIKTVTTSGGSAYASEVSATTAAGPNPVGMGTVVLEHRHGGFIVVEFDIGIPALMAVSAKKPRLRLGPCFPGIRTERILDRPMPATQQSTISQLRDGAVRSR